VRDIFMGGAAMSEGPPMIVKASPDVVWKEAREARARAWSYIFQCHEKKKGGTTSAPDARKESNGSGEQIAPKLS
jgi:hypothetical protein